MAHREPETGKSGEITIQEFRKRRAIFWFRNFGSYRLYGLEILRCSGPFARLEANGDHLGMDWIEGTHDLPLTRSSRNDVLGNSVSLDDLLPRSNDNICRFTRSMTCSQLFYKEKP
eukprot:scaffold11809_cov128-Cylindrotheca_fusiformis.AAC.16